MTSKKTDEDLKATDAEEEFRTEGECDPKVVAQLRGKYRNAKVIERLASGSYAVRFRRKKPVYWRGRS